MLKSAFLSVAILSISTNLFADTRTQCGPTDERVLSFEKPMARMLKSPTSGAGCTGTLISKSCMVSAGHCFSSANFYEFNTAPSVGGKIVHPEEKDIYQLDRIVAYQNGGQGDDWMVVKVKPNKITGEYPGDVQGYLDISYSIPPFNADITIVGYGRDSRPDRNFAQQIAHNEIVSISGTILNHNIDTQGGNSGSSIIQSSTGKIVGIHTHGGCSSYSTYGTNHGTAVALHEEFKAAIKSCLDSE